MYEDVFADEEKEKILPEDEQYRASLKKRIVYFLVFTAVAVAFSFFSGLDPDVENTLMPVHIPVLLGSFVCGGPLGFLSGLLVPLIRFVISGADSAFSDVVCRSFELAVCGCIGGYLFRSLPKKWPFYALNVAVSLISSKITFYVLKYLLTMFFSSTDVGVEVFVSGRMVSSLVSVAFQIIVIPGVVLVFQKAKIAFDS